MLDLLKSIEAVVGIAGAVIGGFLWLIYMIDKRQRLRVAEGVSDLVKEQSATSKQVAGVERRVEDLEDNIQSNLDGLEQRVTGLERSMETVARQGDVANVQRAIGSLEATVKASSTQVAMMFEAQLRREKGDQ